MPEVPPALLDFIREGKRFLIAGHKDPDGDCVGSQLALASVLRRMGKTAIPCSAGPFKRSEIQSYEHFFCSAPVKEAGDRLIVVDCSNPGRTGDLEPYLEGLPLAAIDHHETGNYADHANGVCYTDSEAPSTTVLILRLVRALGLELNREEAELLFFGLCTDTGFFRHVDEGGAETFEAAAALIRAGANPKAAFAAIHGGQSFNSRKFLGHILARAESFFGGKLIVSSEDHAEIRQFGLESRDSDTLYQLLLSVKAVEAIVILRQEKAESCTVGLRSRDWVDVGEIAATFGGGGHKNAAGFTVDGTIAELKPKLVESFVGIFSA